MRVMPSDARYGITITSASCQIPTPIHDCMKRTLIGWLSGTPQNARCMTPSQVNGPVSKPWATSRLDTVEPLLLPMRDLAHGQKPTLTEDRDIIPEAALLSLEMAQCGHRQDARIDAHEVEDGLLRLGERHGILWFRRLLWFRR